MTVVKLRRSETDIESESFPVRGSDPSQNGVATCSLSCSKLYNKIDWHFQIPIFFYERECIPREISLIPTCLGKEWFCQGRPPRHEQSEGNRCDSIPLRHRLVESYRETDRHLRLERDFSVLKKASDAFKPRENEAFSLYKY